MRSAGVTYKKAGVNVDKANLLIKEARKLIDITKTRGSMDSVGGFSGLFDVAKYGCKDPVLVSSCDGVGTKLKIASLLNKHDGVGIDLVAMCVNDIVCLGAKPLFLLDYFAAGKLDAKLWNTIIKSIVKGCKEADTALLGGETAEMPGMYEKGDYDLAAFGVGVIERARIMDKKRIIPGDVLLGIASSGLHSNGFSLVRKIFSVREMEKIGDLLLKPTIIYVRPIQEIIMRKIEVKGIAHITGGGFYDNIPRVFPNGVRAIIWKGSWHVPRVFRLMTSKVKIKEEELYRTFNMGVGMVLVLTRVNAERAKIVLEKKFKLKSWIIGEIVKGKSCVEIV